MSNGRPCYSANGEEYFLDIHSALDLISPGDTYWEAEAVDVKPSEYFGMRGAWRLLEDLEESAGEDNCVGEWLSLSAEQVKVIQSKIEVVLDEALPPCPFFEVCNPVERVFTQEQLNELWGNPND